MQRSLHRHFALHACGLALASAVSSTVCAAELGEVVVRSHIGQQLSADIELVMLTAEDAAGVPVKLAAPNVYQGANTRMHPALASLRMSVVKRDNRQFLHLTTFQPVEAEILHLFLELGTGNRASVRSATIWLTAEPAPVPVPRPAPLRPAAPESAVAGMMAADAALAAQSVQTAQSAESRAVALRAARMRAAAQNALAAKESPEAGKKGGPDHAAAVAAVAPVKPGPAAVPISLGPEARVKRGLPGGAKAACTPGQSAEEAQQCQALDRTNAELKAKLADLEGKVRLLQAALGPGAGPAASAAAAAAAGAASAVPVSASGVPGAAPAAAPAAVPASAAAAASAAPAPAPAAAAPAGSAAKPVAKKKKEAGGINNTALFLGGALLLALVLGLLVYFVRKKKFKFSTAPLKVWQGWRKGKQPAAAEAPAAAEPILGKQ